MSKDTKIKILQALIFIGVPIGIFLYWDALLFTVAIALGFVYFGLAGSIALHKCYSHKSFTPKNRVVELGLLFLATNLCVGSSIAWAGVHRIHHATADTDRDPHAPGVTLWNYIRVWFNYWITVKNPVLGAGPIKDLITDKNHKWFHKHYFKIILVTWAVLALLSFKLFVYYLLVINVAIYCLSYIVTWSHGSRTLWRRLCYRNYETDDYTLNNHLFGFLMFGEGYHNNHHKFPGSYKESFKWYEVDMGSAIIRVIGKNIRGHNGNII